MERLTIKQLIMDAAQFTNEERTPFAALPWQATSSVIWQDGKDTTPIAVDGTLFEYFLEPSVILELLGDIETLDEQALVNRVIQYAQNDA